MSEVYCFSTELFAEPPNEMRISRRERVVSRSKSARISREAVGCMRGLGCTASGDFIAIADNVHQTKRYRWAKQFVFCFRCQTDGK